MLYSQMKPLLYHGTDERIFSMSDIERRRFKQACRLAVDFLWDIFDPYYNQFVKVVTNDPYDGCWVMTRRVEELKPLLSDNGSENYDKLLDALSCVDSQKRGSAFFQYNNLYLTNSISRAENYARRSFAFGEIGRNAYLMLGATKALEIKINPSKEVCNALTIVQNFAESKAMPVILEFPDYNLDFLRREDMRPVTPEILSIINPNIAMSFCYLGSLPLQTAKRIRIP